MDKRLSMVLHRLGKSKTEQDVKSAWARHLRLDYDTADDIDLYTPLVLFEFKFDRKLTHALPLAPVIAQVMDYLHRLKYAGTARGIPQAWCLADRNEAVIGEAAEWSELYSDNGIFFDGDLPPSSPDPVLISAVRAHRAFRALTPRKLGIPTEATAILVKLDQRFSPQVAFQFGDKQLVTGDNLQEVYLHWAEVFGESVRNGFKPSRYFVTDIQEGRTQVIAAAGKVLFQASPDEMRIEKILAEDYQHFRELYEKVRDPEVLRGILAKIDRLTDDAARRREGEFFTPLAFAAKALRVWRRHSGSGGGVAANIGCGTWRRAPATWNTTCRPRRGRTSTCPPCTNRTSPIWRRFSRVWTCSSTTTWKTTSAIGLLATMTLPQATVSVAVKAVSTSPMRLPGRYPNVCAGIWTILP